MDFSTHFIRLSYLLESKATSNDSNSSTTETRVSLLAVHLVLVARLELLQKKLADSSVVLVVTKAVVINLAFGRTGTGLLNLLFRVLGRRRGLLRRFTSAAKGIGDSTDCPVGYGRSGTESHTLRNGTTDTGQHATTRGLLRSGRMNLLGSRGGCRGRRGSLGRGRTGRRSPRRSGTTSRSGTTRSLC